MRLQRPTVSRKLNKEFDMSKFIKGAFLVAALCISPSVAMADESSSATVETSTPLGTTSTQVEKKSDAVSSSTAVKKTKADADGVRSTSYKAEAGPGGASVSKTKKKTRANIDGSVSSSKSNETHEVNEAGSVHKKSAASTTVGNDGSVSESKVEASTSNP